MHGVPVHVGDPAELGIASLSVPQFGDTVEFEAGDVPVLWVGGVTPRAVAMASAPPFATTHAPGPMPITDRADESLTR